MSFKAKGKEEKQSRKRSSRNEVSVEKVSTSPKKVKHEFSSDSERSVMDSPKKKGKSRRSEDGGGDGFDIGQSSSSNQRKPVVAKVAAEPEMKAQHSSTSRVVKKLERQPSALASTLELMPLDEMDILGDLSDDDTSDVLQPTKFRRNTSLNLKSTLSNSASSSAPIDPLLGLVSRRGRTAVYSGHSRGTNVTHVQPLEDLCLRILMDNVEKLTDIGDAPYYLIKPVLQKCTPPQLLRIEEYNEVIIDECCI